MALVVAAISYAFINGGPGTSADVSLVFVSCIAASLLLDLLDGYLSRKLGHTTRFGALFDLSIDLVTHTVLWIASGWPFAFILLVVEWTTGILGFVQTVRSDSSWKQHVSDDAMWGLDIYFRNHQRNAISAYSNVAHFLFPAALILDLSSFWVYAFSAPGLAIYEAATVAISVNILRTGLYMNSKRG